MSTERWAVYRCINKRCREYRTEFPGMPAAEFRRLTGSSVSCYTCGRTAQFARLVEGDPNRTEESLDRSDEPAEFTETEAGDRGRERWARAYDDLNGAPEGDYDR